MECWPAGSGIPPTKGLHRTVLQEGARNRQLVVHAFGAVWVAASPARAAVIGFQALLTPEMPGATGSGEAVVIFDTVPHTLEVFVAFSGISGSTTVAHIHCCVDPLGTAGVATYPATFPGFPNGLTSGSYSTVPAIDLTLTSSYATGFLMTFGGGTAAGAEAALFAGLLAGRAYVNIHTSTFQSGEIRGFLAPLAVPEPATLALLGVAVAAMAARGRRRPL